jgi:phosphoglycerate dehydrogenase-like enzyme
MAMTLFCNAGLSKGDLEELREGVGNLGGQVVLPASAGGTNLAEGESDAGLLAADGAFGQPNVKDVVSAKGLKFVQLSSAGWARYETPEILSAIKARGGVMCTASGVYDEPCATHVLAFMLAHARRLHGAWSEQAGAKGWRYGELRTQARVLTGDRVLLVGYGAIATRLCDMLRPMSVRMKAVRRTVTGTERVPTYPVVALDDLLPESDHVINILPGTVQTAGFFGEPRFRRMKPGAVFYNIGRGTTVDQGALAGVLRDGHLSGAYLDVTDPEPLPATHELWTTPNCFITPHTGGGLQQEGLALVRLCLDNLGRWTRGEGLRNRVG